MKQRILALAVICVSVSISGASCLAQVQIRVDFTKPLHTVPPGAVGWGVMWKAAMMWPAPPDDMATDADHAAYIDRLAAANRPLIAAADVRHLSWPWGVSFSTWGVNWENSAKPFSQRRVECPRILNKGSGWCEKTIIGVGDLVELARRWKLEALTVAVPLSVIDGKRVRWGPGFFDQAFDEATVEKISDHAKALIDYMKTQPGWAALARVYVSAGCEWRHYKWRNPSPAVLSYARLVKRMREKIGDDKVIIVASASDSADIGGIQSKQAASWNRYLYAALKDTPGIALDLHRYRGMIGMAPAPDGSLGMTADNIDRLLATGVSQRNYLTVHPRQWGEDGPAMPTVLLENAIHGLIGDHATHSREERPWVVAMAYADLVREALASEALTFLGWTWFPEDLPREWPHGAIWPDGRLATHAIAQAFLSRYHRGETVEIRISDDRAVRAGASRWQDKLRAVYGGNFSRQPQRISLAAIGIRPRHMEVEILTEAGIAKHKAKPGDSIDLPPLSLFRIAYR